MLTCCQVPGGAAAGTAGPGHQHPAVSGRQHRVGLCRHQAVRVAEEERKESGEDQERQRQQPRHGETGDDRESERAADERQSGGIETQTTHWSILPAWVAGGWAAPGAAWRG